MTSLNDAHNAGLLETVLQDDNFFSDDMLMKKNYENTT